MTVPPSCEGSLARVWMGVYMCVSMCVFVCVCVCVCVQLGKINYILCLEVQDGSDRCLESLSGREGAGLL